MASNAVSCAEFAHGGALFFYRRDGNAMLDRVEEAAQLARDNALDFLEGMMIGIWRGSGLMLNNRFAEAYEIMTGATRISLEANLLIMAALVVGRYTVWICNHPCG